MEGHWGDNGFKNAAYAMAGEGLADPLKTGGHYGICQSKWARLKKDYVQVKFVSTSSGFGWDHVNHLPTAEDMVWDEFGRV